MKNKKLLITILFVLTFVLPVFANQETYRATSDQVRTFQILKNISGLSTVEPTYPITGKQLLILLSNIDKESLPLDAQNLYESLVYDLENPDENSLFKLDGASADATLELGSQIRAHKAPRGGQLKIAELYKKVSDAINVSYISANMYSENVAGRFELGLTPSFSSESINKNIALEIALIEDAMPLTTWVSLGKNSLNLTIGRDRLSAGSGKTGNMNLGDNFTFQNFMKASYINKYFSYDMTIRAFDPEKNSQENLAFNFNMPTIAVADHRFSVALFKRFTVSMAEGMLVYGINPMADIRFLNPLMFMHNLFSFYGGTSNNYMGFEISATLKNGFAFTTQVNWDQLQLSFEKKEENNSPTTFGVLTNITWTAIVNNAIIELYLEGVLTSPYMYQRPAKDSELVDDYKYSEVPKHYETDLYVGNKRADFSEMAPLGWYYGPDSLAIAFGASYKYGKLDTSFSFMYRMHGYRNAWDELKKYTGETSWHNSALWVPSSMAVENIITAGLDFSYEAFKGVEVLGSAALLEIFNYNNQRGSRFSSIQVTLGAKIIVNKKNIKDLL